jgi:hypothetical protein
VHCPNPQSSKQRASSLISTLVMTTILGSAVAGVGVFVSHNTRLAGRHEAWLAAYQFAEAGTVMAAQQINTAFTNNGASYRTVLVSNTNWPYTLTSSNNNTLVYSRTNLAPFTNQPVVVTLIMTNQPNPSEVRIVSSATVRGVTRTNTADLELRFGWTAAILSDHQGSSSSGTSKSTAQQGNVVFGATGSGSRTIG